MARADRTTSEKLLRGADRVVNWVAILLLLLLVGYGGYGLWYNHGLQQGSFLPEELAVYRPDGEGPTLADLKEINPDVTSWLTIPDTNIDYPVVQGTDDNTYLNQDVMGEFSLAGAIFLTSMNSEDFTDPYNVVYGHNIDGGAMFADVLNFREASYFESHPEGILWHVDGRADRILLFAVAEVPGNDEVVYAHPGEVTGSDLPAVKAYLDARAKQSRPMDVTATDRMILLSTCEDAESFNRVVLAGILVPLTDEEIAAAQEAMKEMEQTANAGDQTTGGGIQKIGKYVPRILIPLLLLLLYLWWRRHARRAEKKRENEAKRK